MTEWKRYLIAGVVATLVFTVIGAYAGGAAYLKLVSISLDYLSYDTLLYNWNTYGDDKKIVPYLAIGTLIFGVIAVFPFSILLFSLINFNKEELHGSGRLANDKELKESGLFPDKPDPEKPPLLLGVMDEGKYKGRYVELLGQQFLGVSAGTGQGKGIAIVLPNLVNYPDSTLTNDMKKENFLKSAGFRKSQGQKIFLWSPDGYQKDDADRANNIVRGHRYNPFFYVRRNPLFRVGDIQIIAESLYPVTGDPKADIWPISAGKLFLGVALWMLDTEEITKITPTFPYLVSLMSFSGGFELWIRTQLEHEYLSVACKTELTTYLNTPDETRGGIFTNFTAPLSVFSDEVVCRSMCANDFDFREVRREKISIYIGIEPRNLKKLRVILNLFVEQFVNENTGVLPENDPTLKHQCLALLDEFPALGKVNQIANSIGFTRQYNLRYLLIYQDFSQLANKNLYGKEGAETIVKNFAAEVIYPPKLVGEREKAISQTIGTKTVKVKNPSIGSKGPLEFSSTNNSYVLQKREVIKPDELVALGYEKHPTIDVAVKVLLVKQNMRPFVMKKIIYPDETAMNERVKYSLANVPEIPEMKAVQYN